MRIDGRFDLFAAQGRKPVGDCLFRHGDGDDAAEFARPGERREEVAAAVLLDGRQVCERARGGHDHGVGDAPRPRRYDAESEAGEDVGVVGLVDADFPAAEFHRGEGAAGA